MTFSHICYFRDAFWPDQKTCTLPRSGLRVASLSLVFVFAHHVNLVEHVECVPWRMITFLSRSTELNSIDENFSVFFPRLTMQRTYLFGRNIACFAICHAASTLSTWCRFVTDSAQNGLQKVEHRSFAVPPLIFLANLSAKRQCCCWQTMEVPFLDRLYLKHFERMIINNIKLNRADT